MITPWQHLHPADELAEVRSELSALKAREAELRLQLLDSEDRRGDEWRATVSVQARERLDLAAIRQHLAPDVLAPFWVTSTVSVVKLNRVIGRAAIGFPALDRSASQRRATA